MAAITAPLPLTRARLSALVIGVPVCLLLIGFTGFNLVATLGEAHYPVSYHVPPNARSLNLNLAAGQVLIRQADVGQATLTGTAGYSLVRSTVTEHTSDRATTFGYHCALPFGECRLDTTVTIPAALPVTANTGGGNARVTGTTAQVTLSSGGGNIAADDTAGPLKLNTDGGNIEATHITSETLTVASGGGDITAAGVSSSVISARTDGGNIEATGIATPEVSATSGGGNIEIDFTGVPDNVVVDTSGGNITLVLPPGDTAYNVIPRTSGGEVRDGLRLDSASKHVITATTGGGNITIRQQ
jgi:hypothetical protein